jgi:UDP-N-acetylmuramoyl-L-alanyl-D-glutamate--2,6-diaminopimelate ligase
VAGILVSDGRRAMAEVSAAFFGNPTEAMTVVGVTGTNGKTTVTYLVEAILQAAGRRPSVVGTVGYRFGTTVLPAPHTTPESIDLQRTASIFRSAGADALVTEVSSHALSQARVAGIHFDVGIFTNLTPEHLDYHGDMENYFAAKRLLFQGDQGASFAGRIVLNVDDPYGARLAAEFSDTVTCGCTAQAQVRATERMSLSLDGIAGTVATPAGSFELHSKLLGQFNLQNLLCAAGAGIALGISPATIAEGLAGAAQVPGRLERIENDRGATILVDYAHTGDALEKVLQAVRELNPRRVITVFGCGGDRDRTKRPVMGEVAARLSELVIVTSDNPRSENPLAIIEEIRAGISPRWPSDLTRAKLAAAETGYLVVPDRREALGRAVGVLREGDLLLVAGKGHEDYQIVGGQRRHFDDREELRRALKGEGKS